LKEFGCWKKAYESDLDYICMELRDLIETPACIILNGPVGAGKTTFVQFFSKSLNKSEMNLKQGVQLKDDLSEVTSPTYSIVNEQGQIAHADFYRLESVEDVIHLELNLYAENKRFFFIEWGVDYLKQVFQELGEAFHYYELRIEPVPSQNEEIVESQSRNLSLYDLNNIIHDG
jgi:tRNA threonylcarbamoyladenosine biosynthesis protein TsaE